MHPPLKKFKIRHLGCGDFCQQVVGKVLVGVESVQTEHASIVGFKNACDQFAMGLQELVRQLPHDGDCVVVQTDFENAFNMLDRNAILCGTASISPSSLRLLRATHPFLPWFWPSL